MLEVSGGWRRPLTKKEEELEAMTTGASGCGCG
jgi:hypothetical protein